VWRPASGSSKAWRVGPARTAARRNANRSPSAKCVPPLAISGRMIQTRPIPTRLPPHADCQLSSRAPVTAYCVTFELLQGTESPTSFRPKLPLQVLRQRREFPGSLSVCCRSSRSRPIRLTVWKFVDSRARGP
jgi:hypothetical protein